MKLLHICNECGMEFDNDSDVNKHFSITGHVHWRERYEYTD